MKLESGRLLVLGPMLRPIQVYTNRVCWPIWLGSRSKAAFDFYCCWMSSSLATQQFKWRLTIGRHARVCAKNIEFLSSNCVCVCECVYRGDVNQLDWLGTNDLEVGMNGIFFDSFVWSMFAALHINWLQCGENHICRAYEPELARSNCDWVKANRHTQLSCWWLCWPIRRGAVPFLHTCHYILREWQFNWIMMGLRCKSIVSWICWSHMNDGQDAWESLVRTQSKWYGMHSIPSIGC